MRTTMKTLFLCFAAMLIAIPAVAQTCTDTIDPTTPLVRYTLHDDGTATDRRTGLRWQRCPLGYTFDDGGTPLDYADDGCDPTATVMMDWQDALQAAEIANAGGGFTDWRVPNIKELMTTVERQCASPAVNAVVFPATPPAATFWSSTTYILNDTADILDMATGLNSTRPKEGAGAPHYVRLVR